MDVLHKDVEMLICKPFSPAVTGICNRNKGAEKVWKGHLGHLDLQSSSRWGEIHLLLELLKCIHTTSENNSEAFSFFINCKLFCFYHPSADFKHQLPLKEKTTDSKLHNEFIYNMK